LKSLLDESALRREDNVLQRLRSGSSNTTQRHDRCMEGTRVDILSTVDEWVNDLHGPNIFWLHGHPGTGKSAIATTVRAHLLEAGRLGSSFFFRREDFASQTPEALWCSVAYDLAQKYPSMRHVVVEKLTSREVDPDVTGHYEIFNELIAIPLGGPLVVAPGSLPVIVIDALDECGGLEEARSYQEKVLRALAHWQSVPSQFKIFVTSRNEGNIGSFLGSGQSRCRVLEVGDSVTRHSSMDIENYLRHGFDKILEDFTTIPRPWPSGSELKMLTDAAAGLFIWASTVLKIVAAGQPKRELNAILDMIRTGNVIGEMGNVGQLYQGLLTSKFRTPRHISLFKEVSGAVIAARIPLSAQDLVELLQTLTSTDIEFVCKQLSSVLDNHSGLRFLHQSFVDFLVKPSVDPNFHYSGPDHELQLASACLSTMEHKLHFNMGNITTSYLQNSDIPDLAGTIPAYLYYSCRFWASHLRNIAPTQKLREQMRNFMQLHLLCWIEVLSIRGTVGAATESLESLLGWNLNNELKKLTRDALSFLHSFAPPIRSAVPHIYLSALALSPRTSMIRQNYQGKIQGLIEIKTGGDEGWNVLQGILEGHSDSISSVAFSPDGRLIVSSSYDHTIRIWDADTQMQVREALQGHSDFVFSVAFSPDGRRIVSGSYDHTIRIWDADTQMQVGEALQGHWDSVSSVAFSPDGRRIVSGSEDHTIRMWDADTQMQVGEALQGHSGSVLSVAFSPDGRRIVSGSYDHTIRIWDADTQMQVGEALQGHSSSVRSVAFSPNGRRIVSGSRDDTIRIWDADTQMQVGEALQGHLGSVLSVAFSPNGRRIVSGSSDHTIRIWDADTQMQVGEALQGHWDSVSSVAFSPDGRRIVSGSEDHTIRMWDADTQMQVGEALQGHSDAVWSVAFSPDGRRIVSGSYDHTIRIWDADTQMQVGEALQGHSDSVWSVAFSPDGRRIVSGSYDHTIRIWDADTQMQVGEVLQGHSDSVWSVAFSPDGRRIVSGSGDHT
ncbi:WD40-repeat-containing domain protein, partial [Mycena sp. CBHHK59/15]